MKVSDVATNPTSARWFSSGRSVHGMMIDFEIKPFRSEYRIPCTLCHRCTPRRCRARDLCTVERCAPRLRKRMYSVRVRNTRYDTQRVVDWVSLTGESFANVLSRRRTESWHTWCCQRGMERVHESTWRLVLLLNKNDVYIQIYMYKYIRTQHAA